MTDRTLHQRPSCFGIKVPLPLYADVRDIPMARRIPQADLPAVGPFHAVALADVPARCKSVAASLPREIGTFTFSADGTKVASGAYDGKIEEGGDPTAWILDNWNVKGDLSDVGFGILYAWLGK